MSSDNRIPLPCGTELRLSDVTYIIRGVVGYGGSCLAYSAERKPSEYEQNIGMPLTPAVIKEFYPAELTSAISRIGSNLCLKSIHSEFFSKIKHRFEAGTVNQARFFTKDGDHSYAPTRIAQANGTVYSSVDSVQGEILTNACGKLEIVEIAEIMQSLAYSVKSLHDNGMLHLDIKPSNIFLFNKNGSESRRIALFDFDTVLPIEAIATANITFSDGWSPYEQIALQRGSISYETDIYSIGAVFYWLVSGGQKVTDDVLNAIKRKRFDFIDEFSVLANKVSPRENVKNFLFATLKRDPAERVHRIEELL